MCRITGIKFANNRRISEPTLIAMRDSMAYGGPDAANIYINDKLNVGLGHRRLSILDLSNSGTQPMRYKHWVIVFNGELYNFIEVKKELEDVGYTFSTATDTEVLLKSLEKWGFEALKRFRGMYAFALYNELEDRLTLVRDRVGVKPLYYYKKDGLLLFASELKSFHEHPEFDKTIDFHAVSLFLQQGYIQSPFSIFKHVRKVEPGCLVFVNNDNTIVTQKYWDVFDTKFSDDTKNYSEDEHCEALEGILSECFALRMVSDVPVGMFLSGGVDSSIVTALIQKKTNTQIKTFTIGFENEEFNEAHYAKKVAESIGTDHTELYCNEESFKDLIPEFCDIYDEPFGDSSGIPTYIVSKLAKSSVTVSLSADGGDEIFAGYSKYQVTKDVYRKLKKIPIPILNTLSATLDRIDPACIDKYGRYIPYVRNYTQLGIKFHKAKQLFRTKDLVSQFNAASCFINREELEQFFPVYKSRFVSDMPYNEDFIFRHLGMIDIQTYLEGDIMTKVDRATMQVALEGREPFLDQNIIEYGLNLPDNLKYRAGKGKYILREILYKHVPRELIERPKQGFAVPLRYWLKGILKDELLELKTCLDFFQVFRLNQSQVSFKIDNFLTGSKYESEYTIWFILVLFKWYKRWM